MKSRLVLKGAGSVILSLSLLSGCSAEEETDNEGAVLTEEDLNNWAEEQGFYTEEDLNTWAEEQGFYTLDDLDQWAEERGIVSGNDEESNQTE